MISARGATGFAPKVYTRDKSRNRPPEPESIRRTRRGLGAVYALRPEGVFATEGVLVFDYLREDEGYALLERMEGAVPGYLSYSVREGEVICLFESVLEAEQFYMRWRARIPGEGWGAVRLETGELVKVLRNFDLVSVNPQPEPGATEYLQAVEDFVRALQQPE
jgi:hypothetical protein